MIPYCPGAPRVVSPPLDTPLLQYSKAKASFFTPIFIYF
ncbi:unnamed protein product, partial [Staurois parvus]